MSSSITACTAVSSTKRFSVDFYASDPAECVTVGKIIERQQEELQFVATEHETAQRERQNRLIPPDQYAKQCKLDIITCREELSEQKLASLSTAKGKAEQKFC